MSRSLFLALVLAVALLHGSVREGAAQASGDVELLGQIYGTRPPPSYYEQMARDPAAFSFQRGWMGRSPALRGTGGGAGAPGAGGVGAGPFELFDWAASVIAPRQGAVEGTFHFPLVLGLFSDSPAQPPFTVQQIQTEFFDGPNSYYRTIPEFYDEISGGKVTLVGHTSGWARSSLTQGQVTAGSGALPGRVGEFILQLLAQIDDGTIDWGMFDNDGPDGIPNSGDDDGFVDFLAVMHATQGSECGGENNLDRIWSHKWNLQSATGQTFVTRTPSANGGFIRINDYTIQPSYACPPYPQPPQQINQIGVFAHEIGHAFGLPDLYCTITPCSHAGIGRWGLMGSGSWGCTPSLNTPERPCPMSAWEKLMLGWVEAETLPSGADLGALMLGPVATTGRVFRVDADDGSGNYFLLENRQRIGFDAGIAEPGLLAWRIDAEQVAQRWRTNTVNNDRGRMGVFLLQADGENALGTPGTGNRGDAGDPFPGSTGNTVLHAGSAPSTDSHLESASGLTLLDIALAGPDVHFRALTRFQDVVVRTSGNDGSSGGLLTVDGKPVAGSQAVVRAAPFQTVALEAAPGAPIEDGVRWAFDGWRDDPALPRQRSFVTPLEDVELVAEYGSRREIEVRLGVEGGRFGVSPGAVSMDPFSPDFWFAEGTPVTFTAAANTGFGFLGWTGTLAGRANPALHPVSAPVDAAAVFELTYAVPGGPLHELEAATPQELALVAENGSAPVSWSLLEGQLPEGLILGQDGVVSGAAMETGRFDLTVHARDASGLEATGALTLEVRRPNVGVDALVGLFLLGTPAPTELQLAYLDRAGNRNGVYDLGDLRAFLLAHRDLPMTAEQRARVRTLLPTVTFGPGAGADGGER